MSELTDALRKANYETPYVWDLTAEAADEIERLYEKINQRELRTQLFEDAGLDGDALNSAVDVMRQLQSNPANSLQKILWESIKDYAERAK